MSGDRLPKAGDPDPEEGVEGAGADGHGHGDLPPPHVLAYGSVGWGLYLAQEQQQGVGARTYALRPISSSA